MMEPDGKLDRKFEKVMWRKKKKKGLWHRNQEIIQKIYCATNIYFPNFPSSLPRCLRGYVTDNTNHHHHSLTWIPIEQSLASQALLARVWGNPPPSLPTLDTLLRQPEVYLCLGSSCHWPLPHLSSRGYFAKVRAGPLFHHGNISSYIFWSRMALLLPNGSTVKPLKTLLLPPSYTVVRVAVKFFLI